MLSRIFTSILAMIMILLYHIAMRMILLYPIGDDQYHMHIESCIELIAYIESFMFDYVLGDYVHW